jgi:hypothetical protein
VTAVCPILMFGNHSLMLSAKDNHSIDAFQTDNIKRILGFPKRSNHSKLLKAIGVEPISTIIKVQRVLLLNRIFKRDTPVRSLNISLLASFFVRWQPG